MASSISRIAEKITVQIKPSMNFSENKKMLKSIPNLKLTDWMLNKVAANMIRIAKKASY